LQVGHGSIGCKELVLTDLYSKDGIVKST